MQTKTIQEPHDPRVAPLVLRRLRSMSIEEIDAKLRKMSKESVERNYPDARPGRNLK